MTLNRTLGHLPRLTLELVAIGAVLSIVVYAFQTRDGMQEFLPVLGLFGVAAYRIMPSIQRILSALNTFRYSKPAVDVVAGALAEGPSPIFPEAEGSPNEALTFASRITFEGLRYRYPGTRSDVLQDVSLKIEKGESLGLVGMSGAGKSTLIDLLLGLLEPTGGSIRVDGAPVTRSNTRSWRRNIGYVPQQIFLADDTIARNIAFGVGEEGLDLDRVRRAARAAQLDEFVSSLPGAYSTRIGERGVQLSGGQRQRVGIARALYEEPSVLVLDEATSSLDGATEAMFTEAVKALKGHKTLIIVAHRLTTVKDCDRLVVLNGGRIVGSGPAETLLRDCPEYEVLARSGLGAP